MKWRAGKQLTPATRYRNNNNTNNSNNNNNNNDSNNNNSSRLDSFGASCPAAASRAGCDPSQRHFGPGQHEPHKDLRVVTESLRLLFFFLARLCAVFCCFLLFFSTERSVTAKDCRRRMRRPTSTCHRRDLNDRPSGAAK